MNHDDVTATSWRKSSYSNSQANCVEIARTRNGKVAVRDSRNPAGGALSFSPNEWQTFVTKVQVMIPHSLGAWAAVRADGSMLCQHGTITAAERPGQAASIPENR